MTHSPILFPITLLVRKALVAILLCSLISMIPALAAGPDTPGPPSQTKENDSLNMSPPDISWQKTLKVALNDPAYIIQQTNDGGYIVAVSSKSNGGNITGEHGKYDSWVMKLTPSGAISWEKNLGVTLSKEPFCIQQAEISGYTGNGRSTSNDNNLIENHGTSDSRMVKLTSSGAITWKKSLGGTLLIKAHSIQQTKGGEYIIGGSSQSTDGGLSGDHGDSDYWVARFSPSGELIWQKNLGGSKEDLGYSIRQTTDGGYIIAGASKSDDGDVTGNHGDFDYWIVKLSPIGEISWERSFGGSKRDEPYFIRETSDGGYIVAGRSSSSDGDVAGNHGGFDFWIVKLTPAGELAWERCLGGSADDEANSIEQTSDSGYIVSGSSSSNDGDVTGNHGNSDSWVVKLTPGGNMVWEKSLGGSDYDYGQSILQTGDGGYIIIRESASEVGNVTGHHGETDDWIVKLADVQGSTISIPAFFFGKKA